MNDYGLVPVHDDVLAEVDREARACDCSRSEWVTNVLRCETGLVGSQQAGH